MLTPDLVRARRKGRELCLRPLTAEQREEAVQLASAMIDVVTGSIGGTRDEVEAALRDLSAEAGDLKLAEGLKKLVEDACVFGTEDVSGAGPELRADVFLRASQSRRRAGAEFDRGEVLGAVAAERGVSLEAIERALYADLRGAQVLSCFGPLDAERLVDGYPMAQVQAVLLRAARVTADVRCARAADYRALFHKLKFRRLLYRLEALPSGAFRLVIDGPFSFFESVTKYGLSLALLLPALLDCESVVLTADLRWGKRREALAFRFEHQRRDEAGRAPPPPSLPEEVSALLESFERLSSDWSAAPATSIIDLPGLGLIVPDLCFENRRTGEQVLMEVLGYHSREAVWRRVDLARAGLPGRLLFAVSSRLRVSEEVLDDADCAELYVYKGSMSARAVLRRLQALTLGKST